MPEIEIPEIREIAPPLPPDAGWPLYFWAAIVGGSILALVLLYVIFLRKPRPDAAPPTLSDPRRSALDKLHELKENYLQLPAGEFALGASHGLREYLTGFYGPTTPFETGREFLQRQQGAPLMDEEKFAAVRDLYSRAETLKYAPAPGADSQRLDLIEDIIRFVRDDVPAPRLHPPTPTSDEVPVTA